MSTVTIDIARAQNISTSTASRALRGSYGIHQETKELVLEYAERCNYRPNPIALSTVVQPAPEIGQVAMERLIDLIERKEKAAPPATVNIPTRLIVRDSTRSVVHS